VISETVEDPNSCRKWQEASRVMVECFMCQSKITNRDLYPDLSEEELVEAEHNIERYIKLIVRICERLEAEENDEYTRK